MIITGRHIAAARELLKITRADLARMAEVGISSVYRFEEGFQAPRKATVNAIRIALEQRGIEFINGEGKGGGSCAGRDKVSPRSYRSACGIGHLECRLVPSPYLKESPHGHGTSA